MERSRERGKERERRRMVSIAGLQRAFGRQRKPSAADQVVGWFRYIDDVLMIWSGDETSLSKFMQDLNSNSFNLKFTYLWDKTKINFLDITLCVAKDGSIETDLYRKETSVNSLLHASSAHNYSAIKAIPVGQFLRNRRICSTEARFEEQSVTLTDRFKARGELKVTTREHVRDIIAAREAPDVSMLKTLPRHFWLYHRSDPSGLKLSQCRMAALLGFAFCETSRLLHTMSVYPVASIDERDFLDLEQFAKEEWSKIPAEHCKKLIDGYRKRLVAVILAKGCATKY
ncbi:unnamed protein product [Ranitomeya imitator]|uniref:Reverse transcriptase domain-containing protein n=1 Tax=Ranitomeya imitator TaxID=111125 RepID=A0ABN9M3Q3_9NEOB|nr:unnamed protein product [Ranitomeya imitator]